VGIVGLGRNGENVVAVRQRQHELIGAEVQRHHARRTGFSLAPTTRS
jgi:6-phosphogluconate dehydrogenase (decarboxylating)